MSLKNANTSYSSYQYMECETSAMKVPIKLSRDKAEVYFQVFPEKRPDFGEDNAQDNDFVALHHISEEVTPSGFYFCCWRGQHVKINSIRDGKEKFFCFCPVGHVYTALNNARMMENYTTTTAIMEQVEGTVNNVKNLKQLGAIQGTAEFPHIIGLLKKNDLIKDDAENVLRHFVRHAPKGTIPDLPESERQWENRPRVERYKDTPRKHLFKPNKAMHCEEGDVWDYGEGKYISSTSKYFSKAHNDYMRTLYQKKKDKNLKKYG